MITDDEKIQKAHEIYYRRNGMRYRSEEKSGIGKFVIALLIIVGVVIYQNPKIIEEIKIDKDLRKILNTKINIKDLIKEEKKTEPKTENKIEEKTENIQTSQLKEEPQFDVIWPYKGEITSGFGIRESSNKNINGYHTGIDIAGIYGENILSATNGKVIEISEEGNLGKHIKIQNEKYILIYAHCSEILKQQGEEVSQGETIAKIGSTGNSTGNHLHFEIMKDNNYIDPLSVIEK